MASVQTAVDDPFGADQIRSRACPTCYICGTEGKPLHEGLRDKLFGAPGTWNFKRCPNLMCGLVWLDPAPLVEDIGKAYASYYTHPNGSVNGNDSKARGFVRSLLVHAHNMLLRAILVDRERRRLNVMYLEKIVPARLLEVGCGDGNRLARMRALGWEVEGQEVDFSAGCHARSTYGLPVYLGSLGEAEFPDATFDAIIMNHVIEHVHDPVGLLAECRRVLKVGGTCVAVTPNVEGYGHRYFGACWRGLEPPRHIYLFSPKTLAQVGVKAGFNTIDTWTTAANAETLAHESLKIRRGEQRRKSSWSRLRSGVSITAYQVWMTLMHWADGNCGEECALQARK